MNPGTIEILATVFFGLAVLHTFCVKRFVHWAHHYPADSAARQFLHFLSETEVVFGLWAAALFLGIACIERSLGAAVAYIDSLNFNEPKFVFVIMVMAATRPVVKLAESLISGVARLLPWSEGISFYLGALILGPLLGSFITEPAAMTLLALILKERYFDQGISRRCAYATLGLLFVNISIGGTLTHFAAPPVLMVAAKWDWNLSFMFLHFGWRAASACLVSGGVIAWIFRAELKHIGAGPKSGDRVPIILTLWHLAALALVVVFAHHPDVFFGVFVLFLGVVGATARHQSKLQLREGLLVGFFLAGLVTLGSLQTYWLKPLLHSLDGSGLYFGATGLTAVTDNAALTYLGTLVTDLSDELKYALVAGAVTGGGLTVIANAPNPAGVGILRGARVFAGEGISPLGLFLGALFPTFVAIFFFWVIHWLI
ncbi:MAG TPA: putative Na+/H+ antiporter [Verrucomicrobiota bacterium]|nr:putative Na+/H+ antiporter [Verrucomicrobiota bacterium]HNT16014.1 putative Na+/H+ antiporter [Verrucomicrobiota bacterium]